MIIEQHINYKYAPLYEAGPEIRYFFMIGGRSAGRSKVASQYVVSSMGSDQYFRCALMRLVLADVRNSIFQEVKDSFEEAQESGRMQGLGVKETEMMFKFGRNTAKGMGFKASSGDQKSKLKSLAGFTDVVIEEADEITEDEFMKLDDSLRTKKGRIRIIFMMNPPHKKHWIMKRFFNLIPASVEGFYKYELKSTIKNAVLMTTTYLDNKENINLSTIENFRSYKFTKPEYYYNMIKGYVSEGLRGRIYTNWVRVSAEEFEALPYPVFYGLDFGFTNDPTALVALKHHNGKIYARQLMYDRGLNNRKIAERFGQLGISKDSPIYADSSEPKSIDELVEFGYNVLPAMKGADSIKAGIDFLYTMQVHFTEDSEDIDNEQQVYVWALDRNKEPTNDAKDEDNHAMDAIRYGVYAHLRGYDEPNIRTL